MKLPQLYEETDNVDKVTDLKDAVDKWFPSDDANMCHNLMAQRRESLQCSVLKNA